MARDPQADEVHTTVIAGLDDIYLHVDALHSRCITFLNGGSVEDIRPLLTCADEVLRAVWWLASDSLASLRAAGAIRAGGATYPKAVPDIPESEDSADPHKAIASLESVISEVEQRICGLVHGDADIAKTEDALLLIGHLTTIALEWVETTQNGLLPRPAGLDKAASC